MPLLPGAYKEMDCSSMPYRNSFVCHLLPLGLPFDVTAFNKKSGKEYHIHVTSRSADAIVYVTVVVVLYIIVFVALLLMHARNKKKKANKRGSKRKKRRNTVLSYRSLLKKPCLLKWGPRGDVECSLNDRPLRPGAGAGAGGGLLV